MFYRSTFFVIASLAFVTTTSNAAGIDCAKVNTRSEILICSDGDLRQLDEKLAETYRNANNVSSDKQRLKAEQINWLKERDGCETIECMREIYGRRIETLKTAKPDFFWLKSYVGKSTNALVWDNRFDIFIKSISPVSIQDFGLGEQNLAGALSDALGGPPDKVTIYNDRYLTLSACASRFCPEKGFVWVDLSESKAVAAIVHFDSRKEQFEKNPMLLVFSKAFEASGLPSRFNADLNKWLTQTDTNRAIKGVFINGGGKSSSL